MILALENLQESVPMLMADVVGIYHNMSASLNTISAPLHFSALVLLALLETCHLLDEDLLCQSDIPNMSLVVLKINTSFCSV